MQTYIRRHSIFKQNELKFFRTISEAITDTELVAFKVRLDTVLRVSPMAGNSEKLANLRKRLQGESIDFAIFDKYTGDIIAGIRLDDPEHLWDRAKSKHSFLTEAMHAANIPLLRYHLDDVDAKRIKDDLIYALSKTLSG